MCLEIWPCSARGSIEDHTKREVDIESQSLSTVPLPCLHASDIFHPTHHSFGRRAEVNRILASSSHDQLLREFDTGISFTHGVLIPLLSCHLPIAEYPGETNGEGV